MWVFRIWRLKQCSCVVDPASPISCWDGAACRAELRQADNRAQLAAVTYTKSQSNMRYVSSLHYVTGEAPPSYPLIFSSSPLLSHRPVLSIFSFSLTPLSLPPWSLVISWSSPFFLHPVLLLSFSISLSSSEQFYHPKFSIIFSIFSPLSLHPDLYPVYLSHTLLHSSFPVSLFSRSPASLSFSLSYALSLSI